MHKFQGSFLLLALLTGYASATPAAVIVVTNANDSGAGSLRQALLDSNASVGVADQIQFNIPGAGPHTITLASALPDVTDPVTIDATTQPGYTSEPLIELNGAAVAVPNAVLTLSAGNCRVQGLALNRGPDVGIRIRTNGGNRIYRNHIGTDPTSTIDLGNASHGLLIDNVSNNEIGSPFFGERNVIAGNGGNGVHVSGASASSNSVSDNAIGTDLSVQTRLGNDGWGIFFQQASDNSAQSNVILANGSGGIGIDGGATGIGLENNNIGGVAPDAAPLGNGGPGIFVATGVFHLVQFNTIGFNSAGIVVLPAASGVHLHDNFIFSNVGPEIDLGGDGRTFNDAGDLDSGANTLLNYPVITGITFTTILREAVLRSRLEAAPSTTYEVEVFLGRPGDSPEDFDITGTSIFRESVTTDAAGSVDFVVSMGNPGGATHIACTARDSAGNTSELSAPFAIPDLVADSSSCGATGGEVLLSILAMLWLRRRARAK